MRVARRVAPFVIAGVIAALVAMAATGKTDAPATPTITVAGTYRGETAETWARKFRHRSDQYRAARRSVHELRRELLRRWNYPELLELASIAYAVDDSTLLRKAKCESARFTDFYNEDSGATNVMQFLPSTWATTPYARFSIWNPFAAVLAGAWMHSARVGRGGEWQCS